MQQYNYFMNSQGFVTPYQVKALVKQCQFEQQLLNNIDATAASNCPQDVLEPDQSPDGLCNSHKSEQRLLEILKDKP